MKNKDRVTVTINIKPHLQDFLRHEFPTHMDGTIIINRREAIGLYIYSMWTILDRPIKKKECTNPCSLSVSIRRDNYYILKGNFIDIPVWREKLINDYLEAEFRLRVRDFFTIGYEKGFRQKDIIDGFLQAYNIKSNAINYDMIKQLDFRNRRDFKNNVVKEIQLTLFK